MAVSFAKQTDQTAAVYPVVFGDRKAAIGRFTFDASYPTGGELVTPDIVGFDNQIDFILINNVNLPGSRLVSYDRVNKKLLLFSALSTEVANASDQSTISIDAIVIGK